MSLENKFVAWFDRLPHDPEQEDFVARIVFRAGDTRATESTKCEFRRTGDFDPIAIWETIRIELEDEIQGRVLAYNTNHRQVRSITLRNDNIPTSDGDTVGKLTDCLVTMANQQTRFLGAITDSFETMHETIQSMMYKEREMHEDIAVHQAALMLQEQEQQNSEPSTMEKALNIIAQTLQSKQGKFDIKSYITQNPDILDSLVADEDIITLVMEKMTKE